MKSNCTGRQPAAPVAAAALVVLATVLVPGAFSSAEAPQDPLGPPPGSYRITADDGVIKIPFEEFRSEIRMNAVINGQPARMLIDNGYLWDQLLMFGSPRVDALGLKYEEKIEVRGSGEGDPVVSSVARGVTVTFPGVEFYDQEAIVTPYVPGGPVLWEGSEGQVSAAFFKHFVVDINFDELVLTLIEPDEFRYTGGGVELPLEHLESGAWGMPCTLVMSDGRVIDRLVMWDIGLNGALLFETNGPSQIPLPEKAVSTSLGFGMQGETMGHVGRIRSIKIGTYAIEDVLAEFRSSAQNENTEYDDAMIGFALTKQFNVVFDYPHHRIFLEPNKNFGERIEFDMSGLLLRPARDGLVITDVVPGSPGADAGLQTGDRLTAIDGRPVREYKRWELSELLKERGKKVRITYRRGEKEDSADVKLRPVI